MLGVPQGLFLTLFPLRLHIDSEVPHSRREEIVRVCSSPASEYILGII